MYRIAGQIQHYAWGITGGLSAWHQRDGQHQPDPDSQPEAELWFGAHPNGPSLVIDEPGKTLLDCVDPQQVPLLVKLLAAARPLSIQIHPPTDQAQRQFTAQQEDPLLPKLLADALAKTEMLIALRPFSTLCGMRKPEEAAAILEAVGGGASKAAQLVRAGDPKGAIRHLLGLPPDELLELGNKLPASAAIAGEAPPSVEALAMVVRDYPGDPGVLVAAMLEHRILNEGEAVYVPAGVVHAYIQGTGFEVMTSSDNVLRLGLTPKTVAVEESLAALQPDLEPMPMRPAPVELEGGGTRRSFEPAGAPFRADWIDGGSVSAGTGRYRLVLAVWGQATVSSADATVTIDQGEGAAVLADEPDVRVSAEGSVFIATENQ